MTDDNLDDVQQEKRVPVKELKLTTSPADIDVEVEGDKILIQIVYLDGLVRIRLDRSQAHLLKLYLEEHLR